MFFFKSEDNSITLKFHEIFFRACHVILFRVDSTMLTNSYSHYPSIHAVYCLVLPKLLCLTLLPDRRLLDVFNHDANVFYLLPIVYWKLSAYTVWSHIFWGQTSFISKIVINCIPLKTNIQNCFPVAQLVEHGASNSNIMGSIPRESKTW